jgi:polysaccharide biosynthesis/export protein
MLKRCQDLLMMCVGIVLSHFLAWNVSAQQPSQVSSVPPATTAATVASGEAAPAPTDESYRIGPGDVLDIIVTRHEDYSRLGVRVDNNGMIQMPREEDDIQAACKTVRELADYIKERYKKYLRSPSIYVQVKEFNSQPVAVLGAVNSPGRFQLQRRVRLLELLTFVNGPSAQASGTIFVIHTGQGSMCEVQQPEPAANLGNAFVSYNLKDTLLADEKANPFIRPGDIIRLPEAEQAYVVGNVKTATPIILKEPITLSQAIARSGGLLPEADSQRIRLYRQAPNSTSKTEIIVNLKAINKQQAQDIFLQPNDVIDVPGPSGSRKILQKVLQGLIPMASPLGIIR